MRKKSKKVCCLMVAVLLLFGLAACSTEAVPSESESAVTESVTTEETDGSEETTEGDEPADASETAEAQIPADLPSFKIGVMYYTFTDKLGSQMKNALDYLAEDFNVEFVYLEAGMGTDAFQSTLENGLTSGLDGILAVSSGVAGLEACKNAGDIPFVSIQIEPVDEQTANDMAQYDCYLGAVCENDYQVGYNAIESLYASGVRNLAVCGLTPGLAKSHDERVRGARDAIDQYSDLTLLTEDLSQGDYAKSISSFAAAYPDMDGLFTTFGSEAIYQTINTEGLVGSVKLATMDISESTGDYFDNGTLVSISGGQYGTTMIGFTVLYNYLYDGTRIIPDTSQTLRRPFIEVKSSEDFQNYLEYVDGSIPVYTVDENVAMIKGFNPEVSFETYEQASEDYSLADIVERHQGLF